MLEYEGITTWGNGRFLPSPLPNEFGRADGETAVPDFFVVAGSGTLGRPLPDGPG
ncbi:MAG: hypothetical protein IPM39_06330 [Chloroflexi bacterium]|nr:hypothetical protein [Chloroflexota bacterium]